MPEMPEVETARRIIAPHIIGRKISAVSVFWNKTIATDTPESFTQRILNESIYECGRRAKYLHINLSSNLSLIMHLRMSGNVYVQSSLVAPHKHARVYLSLDNGTTLRFDDPRKFGRIYLTDKPEALFARLGPEPLSPSFTPAVLASILAKTARPIKVALLDQSIIAGLGNIYAIESLWHAKINPTKSSNALSSDEHEALHAAIQSVLSHAIEHGGTDLGDGVWKHGSFTTYCYGKVGSPCSRCATPIVHTTVAQRGTDYCPHCQRENS
jgi:formamidopyrimidine-DNA glycosylase